MSTIGFIVSWGVRDYSLRMHGGLTIDVDLPGVLPGRHPENFLPICHVCVQLLFLHNAFTDIEHQRMDWVRPGECDLHRR